MSNFQTFISDTTQNTLAVHILFYFQLELWTKSRYEVFRKVNLLCIADLLGKKQQLMSHLLGIFKIWMHRGSYMSAHVLLNLLNELRKRDKCEACRAFYLFSRYELNKFNNIRARMLDSIYHMKLRLF